MKITRVEALLGLTIARGIAAAALADHLLGLCAWEQVLKTRKDRDKAAQRWGRAWRREQADGRLF